MCRMPISKQLAPHCMRCLMCYTKTNHMWELSRWSDVLRESSVCVGEPLLVVVWIVTQSFLDIALDLQEDNENVLTAFQTQI